MAHVEHSPRRRHVRRTSRTGAFPCVLPKHRRLAEVLSGLVVGVYVLSMVGTVRVIDSEKRPRELSQLGPQQPMWHEASDDVPIPAAQWPVPSLRLEAFESIAHPANASLAWRVPRFWSPPLHGNRLMPRDRAMRVGTCAVPDAWGRTARGADCPLHQRTIFVAIASYRDFQCRETVESLYGRAAFPGRIRVGVVDQVVAGADPPCDAPLRPCGEDPNQALCRYRELVDVVTLDARESVGPVPARHVGHRMYRGEYYAAQIDAHLAFAAHWDMSLIAELEATGNEMAVISTYLSDVRGAMDAEGLVVKHTRPVMCNSYWKEALGLYHIHHSSQIESFPAVTNTPQLHPWWSAGFSFARGHFLVNVPYDLFQPMVFSGEEMSIAIRGWTVGYDFYTMEHSVCFHYYQEIEENRQKRKDVPTFWENANAFEGSGIAGMRRLLGIVHMLPGEDPSTWNHRDENIYGLGGVRTPERLLDILGFDVRKRTKQGQLCLFVGQGFMHRFFTPKLRLDGMGIDYSQIDFKWRDHEPVAAEGEDTDSQDVNRQADDAHDDAEAEAKDDGEEQETTEE